MNHIDYKKKSTNSYEQLFLTIRELKLDRSAEVEAYRRMIFNLIARNCDDHTKNVSFLLKRGSAWELAPAYDVTFAHNPKGEWTSQHLMSVNGKFSGITRDDLLRVADRFGIGRARAILKDVHQAVAAWGDHAAAAHLAEPHVSRIRGHHTLL